MIFNSAIFIFAFLPVVLVVFHAALWISGRAAIWSLCVASAVFYGWWHWPYLLLLAAFIVLNFFFGLSIERAPLRRAMTAAAVMGNICALAWFKYAGFLDTNIKAAFGIDLGVPPILLPIGISFIAFQQIGYLVDVGRGHSAERSLIRYWVFVSFFPHLIAGPIVRHRILGRQLTALDADPDRSWMGSPLVRFQEGCSLFVIGLFKKVVVADQLALFVDPVFDATGTQPHFLLAWGAALAFSLQIYFDFSAYSDMACGLARMFGFRFPVNFLSPYRATGPAEFWRRWHISLSTFLAEYLYRPLGGNRGGAMRQVINIMVTMMIGGLWHGANWTFVAWGGIHGVLIALDHLRIRTFGHARSRGGKVACCAVTFVVVTLAWVFFRARDFSGALSILAAMLIPETIVVPAQLAVLVPAVRDIEWITVAHIDVLGLTLNYGWIAVAMAVVFVSPNSLQLFPQAFDLSELRARDDGALPPVTTVEWRPRLSWALMLGGLAGLSIASLANPQAFIYFQF